MRNGFLVKLKRMTTATTTQTQPTRTSETTGALGNKTILWKNIINITAAINIMMITNYTHYTATHGPKCQVGISDCKAIQEAPSWPIAGWVTRHRWVTNPRKGQSASWLELEWILSTAIEWTDPWCEGFCRITPHPKGASCMWRACSSSSQTISIVLLSWVCLELDI